MIRTAGRRSAPRERGRPARMLSLWPPLSFPAILQAATPVGGRGKGRAEEEPWHPSRLVEVGKMAEAAQGFVRVRPPRSREAIVPWHGHTEAPKCRSNLAPLEVEVRTAVRGRTCRKSLPRQTDFRKEPETSVLALREHRAEGILDLLG